ncbi:hypothetical protein AcW1_008350 [Taiwanofungus camphoratus]|nr:hypothetical protein AcW1_008350 [Antrodia cinnamomea]
MKLAERYKALEKTLREMQETLRTKDKEIEALRKERDRLVAERDQEMARRRSQSVEARPEKEVQSNGTERRQRGRQSSRSKARARKAEDLPPLPLSPRMSFSAEHAVRACSMDVWLTKTDNWSGAQVIQAVEDLNAEINQFAASATESCVFAKRTRQPSPTKTSDTGLQDEESAPWLGAAFVRVLAARDHTQDPILVQLALQASITTCCARSLSLFCVGFPSKLDALLSRVLAHIQSSEPQATSARWRALTHRSIRTLYPGLEEYATTELVATMLRWSATVFALAGSSAAADPSPALGLGAQLRRIAEAVYKLARVTREEILSTAFEVVLVESGDAFVGGRMTNKMRDYEDYIAEDNGGVSGHANGKTNGAGAEKVLCTTELGLRCVTRKGSNIAPEDPGEGEPFENRMLLLPKVVLDSGVEAIVRGWQGTAA